jgi:drug/metabolite transporter (DMT)-like permease
VSGNPARGWKLPGPDTVRLSALDRQRLLFVVLCLVWGTTWLALKVGVTAVPPALFAGTRWTTAGLALLGIRRWRGQRIRLPRRALGRAALVGALMVACNAVLMLYGLRFVSSGLAAVISSALTPIALLGFSVALRHEAFRPRQLAAIGLGVLGILVLFGPSAIAGRLAPREALGALGVIAGCLCYSLGSVLARPLMRSVAPADVAALSNLTGGAVLLAGSLAFEPGSWHALGGHWGLAAWSAWLFLLLPGSLGATIIYLILVRDWGASRAGTYAFVSPVVAVFLGMAVNGEQVDPSGALGMVLMLGAAALVLLRG